MNTKILARIGNATVALSATLGLFFAPAPVVGQSNSGVPSIAPTISVRVAETASAQIRLRQSAFPLSGDRETEGAGRALASADFDEDGVPDLVIGYADAQGGRLIVQRGNVDAIYPNSPEANARRDRGEFSAAAFYPARGGVALPEAADFLGAGDFDADGHWDIVAAQRDGTKLHWLRGDGRGNFDAVRTIDVAGAVTGLTAGEVNRRDGLTDLAVGIAAADGARVLVFEGAGGALSRAPESFAVAAPAADLAFGELDDDAFIDLAIASGSEVVVVHGRDRRLSLDAEGQAAVGPANLTRSGFEAAVMSIAIGDFTGDVRKELAVLTANRVMTVLDRDGSRTLTMTSESSAGRILAVKVSALPKDDLLLFGGSNEVRIATTREPDRRDAAGTVVAEGSPRLAMLASISAESAIAAVLPMRLNGDALKDLVLVTANGGRATVIESQNAVFVVNSLARTTDVAPGDGICADPNGECSFAAAIEESNAHAGPDTIHFNLPGDGVPVVSTHAAAEFSVFRELHQPVTIDGTTQPGAGRVEINTENFGPLVFFGGNSVLRGVAVYNTDVSLAVASANNIIEGNYVGFRGDGSKPSFGNIGGIDFSAQFGGHNNLIGGTTAQARNVISNCHQALSLNNKTGNVIQGNYVGLTIDGTAALANDSNLRATVSSDVTIGGSTAGAGNVFSAATSGDLTSPVRVDGGAIIQGNRFGTTADGMQPIPNTGFAISVFSNQVVTIGGTTPAARNVMGASHGGIYFEHGSGENTLVQGNYIGTNAAGNGALPNRTAGMTLSGTGGVVIGGAASGAGNLISGNAKNGLELLGGINVTPCRNVVIQGNLIGTDASGTIALPNQESGMFLNVIDNIQIGGTTAGGRNVISGNTKHGLILGDVRGTPSRVQGNFIGVNIFGTGALGNGQHGIHIDNNGGHLIGGTEPGAGNIIAFSGGAGIASSFRDSLGGPILSNSIFANRGLGLDRSGDGVTPFRGDHSEAPVITSVSTSGSETLISGNLRTQTFGPQGSYTIQFFSNTSPDPSGYGEGQTFIGETTITAGGNVAVPFNATVPAVPPGRYISAVAIGVYDTQNSGGRYTSEFSFNVRVPGDGSNNPLQLFAVTPSVGGDTGIVTIKIIGEGIRSGATVLLRRAGQGDIVGTVLSISSDGSTIEATFDLTGQARGGYEIVVVNSDGASSAIANAFIIEQGRAARVSTEIVGSKLIRVGRTSRYLATWHNTGNLDTAPTMIRIYVPRGFALGEVARLEDGSFPAVYTYDAETVLEFYVPRIVPRDTGSTVIQVTPDVTFTNAGVPLRIVAISSPGLKPATDILVDPSVQVSQEVLESTPNSIKTVLHVTSPSVTGDLTRETSIQETSEHRDFSVQRNEANGRVQYVVQYTVPRSVLPTSAALRAESPSSAAGFKTDSGLKAFAGSSGEQVSAVSPTTITPNRAGGTVTVTIRGQGLHSGMTVKLARAGERDVTAKGVSAATNGLSTLVYFDLRGVPLGVWDVVLTGTDRSTGRLAGAFTVEAAFVEVTDVIEGIASEHAEVTSALAQIPEVVNVARQGNVLNRANCSSCLAFFSSFIGEVPEEPNFFDEWDRAFRWTQTEIKKNNDEEVIKRLPNRPSPPQPPSRAPEIIVPALLPLPPIPIEPFPFPENSKNVDVVTSIDPNDKAGPQGAGAQRYITGVNPLSYVILFENKAQATAPAQDVVITDQLDVSKFDLSTFQLGTISFGKDTVVTPPPGLSEWTTDIDLRPANNIIVRVSAALNPGTGLITWRFISLDPATLQPTENAQAGFLPPNQTAPEGDGAVFFNVNAKPGLAAGTEIRNKARIFFDQNAPIDTPEYLNTIDNSVPTSQVEALPPTNTSSEFEVRWSGTDSGAGIETYSIYVSENGGAYTLWITTTATNGFFQGRPNASYSFYSVATDGGGNIEAPPGPADASTTTLSGLLLNISTRVRVQTGENVLIGGLIVTGTDPKRVIIRAIGPSLAQLFQDALANPKLELYQGNTLLASNDNWKDSQQAEIEATTIPPSHDMESAIVQTLAPGFYTAIVSGQDGGTGIGVVEAYDLGHAANSKLANISTRGFVDSGDNVMIGGVIAGGNGGADTRVLIRAIGPSLANAGIDGALQDPTLELRNAQGELLRANDNWQENQQTEIEATTIPPSIATESAMVATLTPGNYTAIVRGKNNATGVGLVEVYNLQ